MRRFYLHVLAEDHVLFRGDCLSMVLPISDGQYGILAGHSNMVAAVVPGTLRFTTAVGEKVSAAVGAGIVKVEANEVLVLVESAERLDGTDSSG